jgi:hypothetical protein
MQEKREKGMKPQDYCGLACRVAERLKVRGRNDPIGEATVTREVSERSIDGLDHGQVREQAEGTEDQAAYGSLEVGQPAFTIRETKHAVGQEARHDHEQEYEKAGAGHVADESRRGGTASRWRERLREGVP